MKTKAVLKNVGISTKKARIPVSIVRGMKVVDALAALKFMEKGTAPHVEKVIKSAVANAQNNGGANLADLYIEEIRVDKGGSRIRHYHPRAKGGGYYMWIRGKSHISVVLSDEKKEVSSKVTKKIESKVKAEDTKPKAKKPKAAKVTKESKK